MQMSNQKKIYKLHKKDIFKIVIFNKIIIFEEVFNNKQVFHFCFIDNKIDLYTNKVYKKIYLVIHTYNNRKKNLVLIYLSKIPTINQTIIFCFVSII